MKLALGRLGSAGTRTAIQRAISLLRRFGTDAHLWLPGGDVKTYGAELFVPGAWVAPVNGFTGSGGSVECVNVPAFTAGYASTVLSSALVAGKSYLVSYEVTNYVQGAIAIQNLGDVRRSSNGVTQYVFNATSTITYIALQASVVNTTLTVSNFSVREITSQTSVIQNGLTTGNYLESTGNTLATVDNPAGLLLDALGTVGSELVTNGGFASDLSGWSANGGDGATVVSGRMRISLTAGGGSFTGGRYQDITVSTGESYSVTTSIETTAISGGSNQADVYFYDGAGFSSVLFQASQNTVGSKVAPAVIKPTGSVIRIYARVYCEPSCTTTAYFDNISVREVSGIHLTQGTTADKGILRLTNGKYNWVFDSTDKLSATIPAGWETATIIDAAPTGAVASVQNVVGTHSIRGAMVTGVNLVTNGGFDSDTSWTKPTGVTIGSGVATFASVSTGVQFYQDSALPAGTYEFTFTVTEFTAGAVQPYFHGSGVAGTARTAVGVYTETLKTTATSTRIALRAVGTTTLKVDNVKIYEINPVTHGRILVNGTLTTAETDLLKTLANGWV